MSTKSGFEIRADLLSQAQGILTDNYQREVDAVYVHNEHNPTNVRPLPLREIMGDEIILVARQLNEFVTEK